MEVFEWLIRPEHSKRGKAGDRTIDMDDLRDHAPYFTRCGAQQLNLAIEDLVGVEIISAPVVQKLGRNGKRETFTLKAEHFPSLTRALAGVRNQVDWLLDQWIGSEFSRRTMQQLERDRKLGEETPTLVCVQDFRQYVGNGVLIMKKGQTSTEPLQKAALLAAGVPVVPITNLFTVSCEKCASKFDIDLEAQATTCQKVFKAVTDFAFVRPGVTGGINKRKDDILLGQDEIAWIIEALPGRIRQAHPEEFATCSHCDHIFGVGHIPVGMLLKERVRKGKAVESQAVESQAVESEAVTVEVESVPEAVESEAIALPALGPEADEALALLDREIRV
jgi:hypothetical protein